jgi:hypothetical protein
LAHRFTSFDLRVIVGGTGERGDGNSSRNGGNEQWF